MAHYRNILGTVEFPEVKVAGNLIPTEEFDRVKGSVCLLKPLSGDAWSGSGFYVNMKLGSKNVHCIMTNYHVFELKEESDVMVAVFHHESSDREPDDIFLVPFSLVASNKELDYVLIRLDESLKGTLIGVKPIIANISDIPDVKKDDTVYIIQHPEGRKKQFSHGRVKSVTPQFIEYFADTLYGSSGSPVFVLNKSTFSLVALHCKGVNSFPTNYNKGVLLEVIMKHLLTGKADFDFASPLENDPTRRVSDCGVLEDAVLHRNLSVAAPVLNRRQCPTCRRNIPLNSIDIETNGDTRDHIRNGYACPTCKMPVPLDSKYLLRQNGPIPVSALMQRTTRRVYVPAAGRPRGNSEMLTHRLALANGPGRRVPHYSVLEHAAPYRSLSVPEHLFRPNGPTPLSARIQRHPHGVYAPAAPTKNVCPALKQCPVCQTVLPPNLTIHGFEQHVNSHFRK